VLDTSNMEQIGMEQKNNLKSINSELHSFRARSKDVLSNRSSGRIVNIHVDVIFPYLTLCESDD